MKKEYKMNVLGIIVTVLMALVISSAASTDIFASPKTFPPSTFDGDILYVGGIGPENYTSIQTAINNALDGDTVYVFPGRYNENIIVNKSINLVGEDKNNTVIDCQWAMGNKNVVFVNMSDVSISGFTIISRSDYFIQYFACVFVCADNITLTDNVLISYIPRNMGITIFNSSNNIIVGNYFKKGEFGLAIINSENNIIRDNYFESSGILFYHPWYILSNPFFHAQGTLSQWNSHIIESNYVNDKPIYYYKNIDGVTVPSNAGQVILANCSHVTIQNLDHSSYFGSFNQGFFGIELGHSSYNNICNNENIGILLWKSSYNTINSNLINDKTNHVYGIFMEKSNYNNIFDNVIKKNFRGIEIWLSSDNSIHNNCFRENGNPSTGSGITLYWSSATNISENTIISNYAEGIFCEYSTGNYIIKNNISDNQYGIILKYASDYNTIYHNNFINNAQHAFTISCGVNYWDNGYPSGGNYWDDYDGSDPDRDGIGNEWYHIYESGTNRDKYPLMNPWPNPYVPHSPSPPDGAEDVEIESILNWISGSQDSEDIVTYDVYFGTTNPPQKVISNQSTTSYIPESLDYETTYYWRIVAWNTHGAYRSGPIWEFTTQVDDDLSPTLKIIKPENGLYLRDKKILPLLRPLIIGSIDIEVEASDEDSSIEKVEFYINDELKITDTSEPYIWTWDEKTPFKLRHRIKIIVYDMSGNSAFEELLVRKAL